MKAKIFLNQLRHDDIVAAIRDAEQKTSGEIRVFISHKDVEDPVASARRQFERLKMTNTRQRNGVLIFLAPQVCKFAVIGDESVHQHCGDAFWREMALEMTGHFKRGDFTQGIVHGVRKAGELLALHFPCAPEDHNELSDEVERD